MISHRRLGILFFLMFLAGNAFAFDQPKVRIILFIDTNQVVAVHLQRQPGLVHTDFNMEGGWTCDKGHSPYMAQFQGDLTSTTRESRSIYFSVYKSPNDHTVVRKYWLGCTTSDSQHAGHCDLMGELIGTSTVYNPIRAGDPMVSISTKSYPDGSATRLEATFRIIGHTN